MDEPLDAPTLRRLLQDALSAGTVAFSSHAQKEMLNDGLDETDVLNVLRAGRWDGCDFERRSWRYRVRTARIIAVVTFWSEEEVIVVTTWRET